VAFDARQYYDQLITTSSLTALLKQENELLTGDSSPFSHCQHLTKCPVDMRQLDGERQSLVYNHHHELIAATDTISAVPSLLLSALILVTE
jgi:vacuolar protein sorting-associated protein 51